MSFPRQPLNRVFVRKTADQSVTNSTTLVNDSHLAIPLGASQTWIFEGVLFANGVSAGDVAFGFSVPTGANSTCGINAPQSGTAAAAPTNMNINVMDDLLDGTALAFGTVGTGTTVTVAFWGKVVTGSTAGNLQLQWAQSTASATASTLEQHSWMKAERVS